MKLILTNKKQETVDVYSFIFKPERFLSWRAGQFLHYVLPHPNPDDRGIERWFTISAAPHEGQIMLTTRFAEKSSSFKKALRDLTLGAAIEADGLEGDFVVTKPESRYVFIAGGIGITPYRSILLDLAYRREPMNVALFYGNRNNDFVFKNELDNLAKSEPNLKIDYLVAPRILDAKTIQGFVPDWSGAIFYVSGPEPMVQIVEKMLLAMGIQDENIKRDYFPGYDLS